ncbi:hypothetical protein [Streptomyces sp. NPDC085540]|uniref:hypothetical protein n=1 Tax=Streptomyces sp. NPDC085540 TaxID=3365730 RepID=UPI0037D6173C
MQQVEEIRDGDPDHHPLIGHMPNGGGLPQLSPPGHVSKIEPTGIALVGTEGKPHDHGSLLLEIRPGSTARVHGGERQDTTASATVFSIFFVMATT